MAGIEREKINNGNAAYNDAFNSSPAAAIYSVEGSLLILYPYQQPDRDAKKCLTESPNRSIIKLWS